MARNNHTPVSYWAALPLASLAKWVQANNELMVEGRKKPSVQPQNL